MSQSIEETIAKETKKILCHLHFQEKNCECCKNTRDALDLIDELKLHIVIAQQAHEEGYVARGAVESQIKVGIEQQARKEERERILGLLPECGIQWMQEGNKKERRGFTDGFNDCLSKIKSLLTK